MNKLNYFNIKAHEGRPYTPLDKKLTLWHTADDFLHCCIESQGCKYSKIAGTCIMCDYGIGKNLTPEILRKELTDVLQPALIGIETILFGSYGSILDEYEISDDCLNVILDFTAKCNVKNIIFETHYSTVTRDKLKRINRALSGKCNITIEMGFESCDRFILHNCIGKIMDLTELIEKINLIHDENIEVCLNVFLGAPFITTQEQTLSAVKSIEWAFSNGANSVVIFPSNIKPFTLLFDIYKAGHYSEISQWQVIDVLNRISNEYLDKISLSWFGDRKNFYENNDYPLIPPKDCEKCHDRIFSFYHNFRYEKNSAIRRQLLNHLLSDKLDCTCREDFIKQYNCNGERLTQIQIERILSDVIQNNKKA